MDADDAITQLAMELPTYITILRRYWLLALTPALLAFALSLGLALLETPRYRSSASLLITRSEDRRFDTEDALAYDLPAIVNGAPFSREVSAALNSAGMLTSAEVVRAALGASNNRRVVRIWAESAEPAQAEAIVIAALDIIQQRGMALWGDPTATPEQTFVNVVVLEAPGPARHANGLAEALLRSLVRGAAGLVAGALLAFGIRYWQAASSPPVQ